MIGRVRIAVCVAIVSAGIGVFLPIEHHRITLDLDIAEAVAIAVAVLATLIGALLVLVAAIGLLFTRRWASRLATWATLLFAAGGVPLIVLSGITGSISAPALVLFVLALSAWLMAVLLARRSALVSQPVSADSESTL